MSRGERQESRGVEKIREIWKRKRVIELQKIEAVDEKRKRGTRKEGKAHRPVGHCQGMGSAFCYARNFISNVSNFRSC